MIYKLISAARAMESSLLQKRSDGLVSCLCNTFKASFAYATVIGLKRLRFHLTDRGLSFHFATYQSTVNIIV